MSGLAFLMLSWRVRCCGDDPNRVERQHDAMKRKPKFGIILLGFGGHSPLLWPSRPLQQPGCEADCFVAKVLGDDPDQADRVTEVAAHYHHLGGFSDYNPLTFQQRDACRLNYHAWY